MRPVSTFRRKFGKAFFVLSVTLLFGWGLYAISNWLFTIRSIEVVGENAIVQIDEQKIGRNLLFFPSEQLHTRVLADNPWLSDVRFEKRFPGTLRIVPTRRQPIAVLVSGDRTVLVDKEGMVVGDGDGGSDLPRLRFPPMPLRVGEIIGNDDIHLALALTEGLAGDIAIRTITRDAGGYLRAQTDTLNIIIAQDQAASDTLATLQTLLTGFRIKGTLPTVVDLRFDKPVVKF